MEFLTVGVVPLLKPLPYPRQPLPSQRMKDGVKVLLVPLKMVHVPKPSFGEGTNLLTRSGVEKALMENGEGFAIV
ncbi:hypothetical protein FCV25MIE_34909, partial [Fagus crenata]